MKVKYLAIYWKAEANLNITLSTFEFNSLEHLKEAAVT